MRRFLYTITVLIVLVAAVLFALRMWSRELTEVALVPTGEFTEQEALADNAYANPQLWFSRPGMGAPNDPVRWQPSVRIDDQAAQVQEAEAQEAGTQDVGAEPASEEAAAATADGAETPRFAVFFVHPTSFFDNSQWNAALDDEASQDFARTFVRGMGSAFNQASEIWAPRYRQATFGALISSSEEADQAIDSAYHDVAQAFAYFTQSIDPNMPIVIAGHSQGALHVLRLMREEIAGSALQSRVAMAYPIGWPISVEHDLPALPLPACATPQQAGCVVSWASFAEPADPGIMMDTYSSTPGFDGQIRGDSPILCVNPLSGTLGGTAEASANLGTLVPSEDLTTGDLVLGAVPARCGDGGLLLIGDPPRMGSGVLPFNNYHLYDIVLFWANLQADVVRRVSAWEAAR